MKLNIPVSLVLMYRDLEIEQNGRMTTYKLTVAYTGFPYKQTSIRFMAKCFQGRNREAYYQELTIPISRGLTIMCFCNPSMRLIEKMVAVKPLKEPILASWQSQEEMCKPNQLLIIDYSRKEVEEAGIVPVDDFKKISLVTSIIHCLAAWRISRDDIPKGILPDHLWERIWEIRVTNPIMGDLGPICTNPFHTRHFGDASRSSYLPRVLRAWAPPPEEEDPEADPDTPHP
jgi:hypothetical protein